MSDPVRVLLVAAGAYLLLGAATGMDRTERFALSLALAAVTVVVLLVRMQ